MRDVDGEVAGRIRASGFGARRRLWCQFIANASPTPDPMTALSDSLLWSLASIAYGHDLSLILGSIVITYQRRPGLDNLILVHSRSSALLASQPFERPLPRTTQMAFTRSKVAWEYASLWAGISYAICSRS